MSDQPQQPTAAPGPNWGLAFLAVLVIGVAVATFTTSIWGVRLDVTSVAPGVLVGGGLLLVVIGQLGLLRQRRRAGRPGSETERTRPKP